MAVIVRTCPLFWETFNSHKNNLRVVESFNNFRKTKEADPLTKYGSSDYPFRGDGPLHGIPHAHLTHDVSILYTLSGRNPHELKLIAILSHDQAGTGTPPNLKKQKQLQKRIDQQVFTERKK